MKRKRGDDDDQRKRARTDNGTIHVWFNECQHAVDPTAAVGAKAKQLGISGIPFSGGAELHPGRSFEENNVKKGDTIHFVKWTPLAMVYNMSPHRVCLPRWTIFKEIEALKTKLAEAKKKEQVEEEKYLVAVYDRDAEACLDQAAQQLATFVLMRGTSQLVESLDIEPFITRIRGHIFKSPVKARMIKAQVQRHNAKRVVHDLQFYINHLRQVPCPDYRKIELPDELLLHIFSMLWTDALQANIVDPLGSAFQRPTQFMPWVVCKRWRLLWRSQSIQERALSMYRLRLVKWDRVVSTTWALTHWKVCDGVVPSAMIRPGIPLFHTAGSVVCFNESKKVFDFRLRGDFWSRHGLTGKTFTKAFLGDPFDGFPRHFRVYIMATDKQTNQSVVAVVSPVSVDDSKWELSTTGLFIRGDFPNGCLVHPINKMATIITTRQREDPAKNDHVLYVRKDRREVVVAGTHTFKCATVYCKGTKLANVEGINGGYILSIYSLKNLINDCEFVKVELPLKPVAQFKFTRSSPVGTRVEHGDKFFKIHITDGGIACVMQNNNGTHRLFDLGAGKWIGDSFRVRSTIRTDGTFFYTCNARSGAVRRLA